MTERHDCSAAGAEGAGAQSVPQQDMQSTLQQDAQSTPNLVMQSTPQLDTHITPPLNMQQDPSSTGPMSLEAINAALAMNQHYYEEAQAQEAAVRKKGRRLGRWIGVAAVLAAVAVVGLLGYMQLLVDTVNQVDDDRVMADIIGDEAFAQGSASDAFVEPAAYTVDSVEITDRQTNGQDVVVKADVCMSNGYFRENRKVTMTYVSDGDDWQGECDVDSHSVTPLRGIVADEEYGIWEADAAYDAETQTCTASRWVEGSADDTWFMTTQGTEVVSYAFADDAWGRSGVDDSQLVRSFQGLTGGYQVESTASTLWTASSKVGRLQDLQITWVDDASGQFGGTFTWTSGTSRTWSANSQSGEFVGWIDESGNVSAEGDGSPGTLSFTGYANENGGLTLDYNVYYTNSGSFFSEPGTACASGTATLYKGDGGSYEAEEREDVGQDGAYDAQEQGGSALDDLSRWFGFDGTSDWFGTDDSSNSQSNGSDGGWYGTYDGTSRDVDVLTA
ncbi:MAG: hypothetical protein J5804_03990 [Eggerthellaceae bacterium]|nr:hypothetical protein [Eggerthellaceae bacterium]